MKTLKDQKVVKDSSLCQAKVVNQKSYSKDVEGEANQQSELAKHDIHYLKSSSDRRACFP